MGSTMICLRRESRQSPRMAKLIDTNESIKSCRERASLSIVP